MTTSEAPTKIQSHSADMSGEVTTKAPASTLTMP